MSINQNNNGRFIFVDPNLKSIDNDSAHLSRAIVNDAVKRGYRAIVFSNHVSEEISDLMDARIEPVFTMTTLEYYKLHNINKSIPLIKKLRIAVSLRLQESFKITLRKLRQKLINILDTLGNTVHGAGETKRDMHNELLSAMLKYEVNKADHVFIYPADAVMYRLILQLLQHRYPLGEYPCFHICTPYGSDNMPGAKCGMHVGHVINYLRLMGLLNQYVFLYAENELLADSLTSEWAVDVRPLRSHELTSININQLLDSENRIKHAHAPENDNQTQESLHNANLEDQFRRSEIDMADHDDTCHENKYNEGFSNTATSNSRNLLFIKQIS
jgi:hypothetical protein